jgi:hypothetical protein
MTKDINIPLQNVEVIEGRDSLPQEQLEPKSDDLMSHLKEKRIAPQEPERKPSGDEFNIHDLLLGATPALIGLLTGAEVSGFDESSNLYGGLYKHRENEAKISREERDKLLKAKQEEMALEAKLEAARLKAQDRKLQKANLSLDGKAVGGSYDPATGEYMYQGQVVQDPTVPSYLDEGQRESIKSIDEKFTKAAERRKGLDKAKIVDPITGMTKIIRWADISEGDLIKIDPSKFNPKQEEYATKFRTDLKRNKTYEKAAATFGEVSKAKEFLISGNPLGHAAIKRAMARMSGEVGVLTEKDVSDFGGSQAIKHRLNQLKETSVNGLLTKENKKYLLDLTERFEAAAKKNMGTAINGEVGARKGNPYLSDDVLNSIGFSYYKSFVPEDTNTQSIDNMSEKELDEFIKANK